MDIFYDAGPVITRAKFIGFCYSITEDECTHATCGAVRPHRVCPQCGKKRWGMRVYDYNGNTKKGHPDYNPNYGKLLKGPWACTPKPNYGGKFCGQDLKAVKIQGGEKVKCKMSRFRSFTPEELANPETTIRFALISAQFAAITGWHLFVADLEEVDFINKEMKRNANKGGWTAYDSDTPSPVDISKIINKVEVISQIGKIFGQ